MRGPILRISAVILPGLALALGAGWGTDIPAQPGETVPDEVAATLRGGLCLKRSKTTCVNGVNPDYLGRDCRAKTVIDYDNNGTMTEIGTVTVYCGGTQNRCASFFSVPGAKCATSGTVTAAPE